MANRREQAARELANRGVTIDDMKGYFSKAATGAGNMVANYYKQRVGDAESLASLGSGIVAEPIAGLAGIAALPYGEDNAASAVKYFQDILSYQPRTEAGKERMQQLGGALAPVGEAIESASSGAGDYVYDKTGSPGLAAAAYSAPTAAMELLGLKGVNAASKSGKLGKQYEIADAGHGGMAHKQRGIFSGVIDASDTFKSKTASDLIEREARAPISELDFDRYPSMPEKIAWYLDRNPDAKPSDVVLYDDAVFYKQPDGSYIDHPLDDYHDMKFESLFGMSDDAKQNGYKVSDLFSSGKDQWIREARGILGERGSGAAPMSVSKEQAIAELAKRGIPMDYDSRMARAKEQGYDTDNPIYRGQIGEKALGDPHDVTTYASPSFAKNPDVANVYAENPDAAGIFGLYGAPKDQMINQNIAKYFSRGDVFDALSYQTAKDSSSGMTVDDIKRLAKDLDIDAEELIVENDGNYAYKVVVDDEDRLAGLDDFYDTQPGSVQYLNDEELGNIQIQAYQVFDLPQVQEAIARKGYSGVRHRGAVSGESVPENMPWGEDIVDIETKVFNPEDLRSVNAAFNPADMGKNGLLKSILGAGLGYNLLSGGTGEDDVI